MHIILITSLCINVVIFHSSILFHHGLLWHVEVGDKLHHGPAAVCHHPDPTFWIIDFMLGEIQVVNKQTISIQQQQESTPFR